MQEPQKKEPFIYLFDKELVSMAGLKIITAPATEPVTLAQVKLHLGIDISDGDDNLESFIKSAREDCEDFQNYAYITQTWELTLDKWPEFPFKLPKPPLISVTSIKYYDFEGTETTWATTEYIVDTDSEPGRITLAYNKLIPTTILQPINGIKIRYVVGYGAASDVPESVKQAIKLLVGDSNENRESTSDRRIEELPPVYRLLWKNRRVPI